MKFAMLMIAGYLAGSIPFGLIMAKFHGKDLRSIGSGNIGATNVGRAMGKKWGYFCFILDVLKGFIPVLIASNIITSFPTVGQLFFTLGVGCAAILGHIFPVYVKFKGGKGVATSFGIALGLWPYFTICALSAAIVWLIFVLIWRYVSLASMAASVTFPFVLLLFITFKTNWDFVTLWPLFIAAIAIPMMVIIRHRDNIGRLISGTESKIFKRSD